MEESNYFGHGKQEFYFAGSVDIFCYVKNNKFFKVNHYLLDPNKKLWQKSMKTEMKIEILNSLSV